MQRIYPYSTEPTLTGNERTYIEGKIAAAIQNLNEAAKSHEPKHVIGLMSGGDDSAPACYIASLHPLFNGIVHIDTGIGIEQTRQHVRQTCLDMKWPLTVMKAVEYVTAKGVAEPAIYEEIVKWMGFPGPAQHGLMYQRLKERQLIMFERQNGYSHKPGERVMFVSGVRAEESARRKKNTTGQATRKGRKVWCGPIWDWTKKDCQLCRRYAGMKRNPVAELIHKSGECLCGAFAEPGELAELSLWFPEVASRIKELQKEVYKNGFPWGWEESPPAVWVKHKKDILSGQGLMMDPVFSTDPEEQVMCTKCNLRSWKQLQDGIRQRNPFNP